ncbi:metal-dependent hydrolase family protein [Yunchengibacter salinarum]|uniref:metal-dependent hydrolase family protein n=1 Tax=Yunchengibacter salinarum TaxID=3133399 RepID=UPI0035B6A269
MSAQGARAATAEEGDSPAITVIHAGTLLAVPGKKAESEQTLILEGERVKAVRDGFVAPEKVSADARLIDLSDRFVMPGLMDMHVHLQGELGPDRDKRIVHMSPEDVAMESALFARRTLMAGFTTVRDVGNDPASIHALRKAVDKGWVPGPRIVAATMIAATGGHGDIDGMNHHLLDKLSDKSRLCDSPDECRKAVRRAIKYGADLIKITATGGVLSDTTTGTGQQMTDAELEAIMDTAHSLGKKVAAHAHAAGGINAALRAGVDSVEHGSYANAETHRLMKQGDAMLVPTLLAGHTVVQMAKTGDFMSPPIRDKAIRVGGDMMDHFREAVKAGVTIAYGTDSGVSRHGTNAEEAVLMKKGGMGEMAILKSATVTAARLIDREADLGTLEAGKLADIVAYDTSPLEDIATLKSPAFVMQGGVVHLRK